MTWAESLPLPVRISRFCRQGFLRKPQRQGQGSPRALVSRGCTDPGLHRPGADTLLPGAAAPRGRAAVRGPDLVQIPAKPLSC